MGMFEHRARRCAILSLAAAALCNAAEPGLAATHEQIVDACHEAARPAMVARMQGRRGLGDHDAAYEQCRQSVGGPFVKACVLRQEQKEAASKTAPAAPVVAPPPPSDALSRRPTYVAPPRTTADITAILEREKPDAGKIAARKAEADARPPAGAAPAVLEQFYYDRGVARALLDRNQDALADALKSLDAARSSGDFGKIVMSMQAVARRYGALGDPKKEAGTFESIVTVALAQEKRAATINALGNLASIAFSTGEISQGEAYARRVEALVQEARGSPAPGWRKSYPVQGNIWEADAANVAAAAAESRGQYAQAESFYRRSEAFRRASVNDLPKLSNPAPREQLLQSADGVLMSVARMAAKHGRLSEAESLARKALLDILDQQGRYNPATPGFINGLAGIVSEEGRYREAESLARAALDTQSVLGGTDDSPTTANILSNLGNILVLQGKAKEAQAIYAQLDQAVANWPEARRDIFQLNGSRVAVLYAAGQVEAGVAAAEELVKRETARKGANSFDAAIARGQLAIGYSRSNRAADALREFKTAIPIMTTAARESADDDDPTVVAAKQARLQRIVEAHFNALVDQAKDPNDVADETFALSDAIRGHAVGHSLADASARLSARDPALAELVRGEQDLSKQIEASLGPVNNLLSLPPDGQRDQEVNAASAVVAELRTKRDAAVRDIAKRFPAYASLINPKPPSLADVRAALRPGEAMLSFYFGRTASFVWAAPKDGAAAFARIPMKAGELDAAVRDLRKALEPEATRVEDIPPFDVGKAYALYAALMAPVESGWKDAKSLVAATNGALGELPLGLLPTANVEVDAQAQPLFAGYRAVPWLARTRNVTVVPSASAFLTLGLCLPVRRAATA